MTSPETAREEDEEEQPKAPDPQQMSEEELAGLKGMHVQAIGLNRVVIHTNFQQAIQEAFSEKPRDVGALCTAFHHWAEAEALMRARERGTEASGTE